jgi:tRNA (guanine-N1)-methyltransferase
MSARRAATSVISRQPRLISVLPASRFDAVGVMMRKPPLPDALGNKDSAIYDSFSQGCQGILEHPLYTRPILFEGMTVPPVLISGHHEKIRKWKESEGASLTRSLRPELLPPTI